MSPVRESKAKAVILQMVDQTGMFPTVHFEVSPAEGGEYQAYVVITSENKMDFK
jgi:hypothetical protein